MKKKIIKSSKQVEKEKRLKRHPRTCPECVEWHNVLVTERETEAYYICRKCGCEWKID